MSTMTHTSNPALSEQAMLRAAEEYQPGWAAPGDRPGAPPVQPSTGRMTMGGVVTASAVLLALLCVAAAFGWSQVEQTTARDSLTGEIVNTTTMPGWTILAMFGGLGVAILTVFKPGLARFTGPLYALIMGTVVGAISAVYNASFDGIVIQAVLCTIGVFLAMLFLFATRIIRVTERLRMMIVASTIGVLFAYLGLWIVSLFTDSVPLINDTGVVGIGFSLLIVAIASFNLLLDFDFMEKGIEAGLPRGMEWYAAFGLLVTLVWLYLEILRLLAKLRQ
jgi:uncharacterized YccA/Bax inhibitor family protein